jgi:hypothetical protein
LPNASYFYQWRLNGNNINGATATDYKAATNGVYDVVVTNSSNCTGMSAKTTINVISLTQPSVIPSGPTTICAGNGVLLSTTPAPGLQYTWIQDTSVIASAVGSSYVATATGNYMVVITNGKCSATSAPMSVVVNPRPTDSLYVNGGSVFCQGSTANLDATYSSTYSYLWLRNGAPIAGAPNASTYTVNQGGVYAVTITDNNTLCSNTSPVVNITFNPLPVPVVSLTGGASLSTVAIYSAYQWNYGSSIIPGAVNPTYTATKNGLYSVTVTDAAGCTGTSVPVNVTTVGVGNVNANNEVRIYPNPASAIVHIDAPYKVTVTISSIDGKEVLYKELASDVDISKLADGVYMIKVANLEGNQISIEKLVKTK